MRSLTLKVVASTVIPGAVSLRSVESLNDLPHNLRHALKSAGYQAGDVVVLVDKENTVLTPEEVSELSYKIGRDTASCLSEGLIDKLGL